MCESCENIDSVVQIKMKVKKKRKDRINNKMKANTIFSNQKKKNYKSIVQRKENLFKKKTKKNKKK